MSDAPPTTPKALQDAVRTGAADACLVAGLRLEQARGADNDALLTALGAEAFAGSPPSPQERRALLDALVGLLRFDPPPPTEALWALRGAADPEALAMVETFLERCLASPAHDLWARGALNALLPSGGEQAERAAAMVLRAARDGAFPLAAEDARDWLEPDAEPPQKL